MLSQKPWWLGQMFVLLWFSRIGLSLVDTEYSMTISHYQKSRFCRKSIPIIETCFQVSVEYISWINVKLIVILLRHLGSVLRSGMTQLRYDKFDDEIRGRFSRAEGSSYDRVAVDFSWRCISDMVPDGAEVIISQFENNFLIKTQENVKEFLSEDCWKIFLKHLDRNEHWPTFCDSMEQSVQQNARNRLAVFLHTLGRVFIPISNGAKIIKIHEVLLLL